MPLCMMGNHEIHQNIQTLKPIPSETAGPIGLKKISSSLVGISFNFPEFKRETKSPQPNKNGHVLDPSLH